MENLKHYEALRRPPETALKAITGGRLKGKSDINPQWRIEAMTKEFGVCGFGWKFEVVKKWTEPGTESRMFAFVDVLVYVKDGEKWSDPIPGTGGSMLIEKEKDGLYNSDEAFKMALTDALSVALKFLGVAADIYMGLWDGSKYTTTPDNSKKPEPDYPEDTRPWISEKQVNQAVLRIQAGEDLYPELNKTFRMSKVFRYALEHAKDNK